MKTTTLIAYLHNNLIAHLDSLYQACGAYTPEEKHVVRGVLSTLKKRGIVTNLGNGIWMIV